MKKPSGCKSSASKTTKAPKSSGAKKRTRTDKENSATKTERAKGKLKINMLSTNMVYMQWYIGSSTSCGVH